MKTIALSAGHSNTDPGAVYNGLIERDLNIKIVDIATKILRANGIGVITIPNELSLTQTIKYINDRASQINVCLEVHINSSSKPNNGVGLEGWYYRNSNTSKQFIYDIVDATQKSTGMGSRGVKDEYNANIWHKLGFVHDTKPLAGLIECGFINSDTDRKVLSNEEGLYNIGKGIALGILDYFGITYTEAKTKEELDKQELIEIKSKLADIVNNCYTKTDLVNKVSAFIKLY
jgi:N-acetylmuramoyl-L-alanine amidase